MNYIKGHILVNSFYKTEKFMEHYHCLQNSAKRQGLELDIIENSKVDLEIKSDLEVGNTLNHYENSNPIKALYFGEK